MKTALKLPLVACLAAIPLAFAANTASAAIVCNTDGDCWHAHQAYQYRPEFNVTVHPDNWRWKEGERHAWREHDGRGYWHGGEWKAF